MISRRQIALVHVARNKVGMTEPEYRDLLAAFGAASSTELKPVQFEAVMQQFQRLGFVPKRRRKYRKPPESKARLTAKAEALRVDMGLTHSYLDAMARTMFRVDAWRWLDSHQLHSLVKALIYHQRRTGRG